MNARKLLILLLLLASPLFAERVKLGGASIDVPPGFKSQGRFKLPDNMMSQNWLMESKNWSVTFNVLAKGPKAQASYKQHLASAKKVSTGKKVKIKGATDAYYGEADAARGGGDGMAMLLVQTKDTCYSVDFKNAPFGVTHRDKNGFGKHPKQYKAMIQKVVNSFRIGK